MDGDQARSRVRVPFPAGGNQAGQTWTLGDPLTRAAIIFQVGIIVLGGLYLAGARMMSILSQLSGTPL